VLQPEVAQELERGSVFCAIRASGLCAMREREREKQPTHSFVLVDCVSRE
jgi:hypothetical protein